MGKIKPSQDPRANKNIRAGKTSEKQHIIFSFKHIDFSQSCFCLDCIDKGKERDYLGKFLERLKNISEFTIRELIVNNSKALRFHPIKWEDTSSDGFTHLNEQLQQLPAYQFGISANQYGRVHGFVLENTFYIVWIDPQHNLYP